MSRLKDFIIENSVIRKYIGPGGDVVIPKGISHIGNDAFAICTEITSLQIPFGVKSIGILAFDYCTGLKRISFSDSVRKIGRGAFSDCGELTELKIPNSVIFIGDYAFSCCGGLEKIEVAGENPVFHSNGNCMIKTKSKTLTLGCKTSVIPADGSVKNIGQDSFFGCIGLTDISIPDGVIRIGKRAFCGCRNLEKVTVPDSVCGIANDAFYNCSKLIIHASAGSYAERYAERNDILFLLRNKPYPFDI